MTIDELLARLVEINSWHGGDPEAGHFDKDKALLEYIGSESVTEEFNKGSMWYA